MTAPVDNETLDDQGEVAVSIRNVFKLFGGDLEAALELAGQGADKEQVQEETGSVMALNDVSLDAMQGEIFVVMGLSGCGKSTLIRCINRLIEPTSGEIWLGGQEITALDEESLREIRRHEMAMVFQHYGLLPHRTVIDNVGLGLELGGVVGSDRRARSEAALETVGLGGWGSSMPSELSGGMKQRVGLARALAHDSPVLLMDEPFSALDPLIRRELQDPLLVLQEQVNKTIVFITHDLDEAVRIGARIAIMREGSIAQLGTPIDVVLNPADSYVKDFTKEVRQHALVTAEVIMGDPIHLVHTSAKAAAVLESLIDSDQNYAMVVDESCRYVGTALLQRIERARPGPETTMLDVPLIVEDVVSPETVLDDLVPLGLRSEHSIPVLNDASVLVGEVSLETLAEAMQSTTVSQS